jgi:hypothetical protein
MVPLAHAIYLSAKDSAASIILDGYQLYSLPVLRYFSCIDINLFISSSSSAGLHSFAIFKTSLISLLPVFHTEEAIVLSCPEVAF